jgi:hypothetical protein
MPNKQIVIAPNVPIFVCLVDPEGQYDMDLRQGVYQTTTGDLLVLPRPAVIALNMCEPRPGEEIVIQKHWSGKTGDSPQWTVALSTRSELSRASEATDSQDLTEQLERSIEALKPKESPVALPVPIRKPAKKQDHPEQPRLFDRRKGTGTDGPAPQEAPPIAAPVPARAVARYQKPGQIPANIAVREVLHWVNADPNTINWSDQSKQDLLSTILIAAYRAGHIGLWERGE